MRKAFIAAPLIGTIIFVTAIVFVVNINKSETNAITQISQEAYHNRINSIVELYRADAGSLFREDVKKVVEQALTSQCWSLFNVQVPNDPTDSASEKTTKLRQARYDSCEDIKSTIQSVICSNTGEDDAENLVCVNSCTSRTYPNAEFQSYASCLSSCGGGSRSYGLQNFFNNINEDFEFEGMTLSPANKEKFEAFFKPKNVNNPNEVDLVKYISNCRVLMKELTMDCAAFAGTASQEPVLQCCDKDVPLGETCQGVGGEIIPGCENGIFYVKVAPGEDDELFQSLPRIQAADGAGNYLRAGALGDVDIFYLPINFPLMKYLDASFTTYQRLAYGENIGGPESNAEAEGVHDGVCAAPSLICQNAASLGFSNSFSPAITSLTGLGRANPYEARAALADVYYNNVVIPAFSSLPQELRIAVLDSTGTEKGTCGYEGGGYSCDEEAIATIKAAFTNGAQASGPDAAGLVYPYLVDPRLSFKIIDTDPSFKVKKDEYNKFCTAAILKYDSNS